MSNLELHTGEVSYKHPILIFGIGPVVDRDSRLQAESDHTVPGNEDIPFWSKNLAQAAAFLNERNVADSFVVMGGKTGGEQYLSEAALIRKEMMRLGIHQNYIKLEERSYDTPTNLINFVNLYTSKDSQITEPVVNILGASWHLHRLRVLMKLLAIPLDNAFAAEEVLRYKARNPQAEQNGVWDNELLLQVEQILDVKEPNAFYQRQKGTEKRGAGERYLNDNLWVREMLTYPSRLLYPCADIENDTRLIEIVKIASSIHTPDEMAPYGINLTLDDPQTLRAKMRQYPWPFLVPEQKEEIVDQWRRENVEKKGWPLPLLHKLQLLLNYN